MAYGKIDLENYEYMIIYSEPSNENVINTWTLPNGSFQIDYASMVKHGCIIRNVFCRMSESELLQAMVKEII